MHGCSAVTSRASSPKIWRVLSAMAPTVMASFAFAAISAHSIPDGSTAKPFRRLRTSAPGMIRADGRNGFSLPVLAAAHEALVAKARDQRHCHAERAQGASLQRRMAGYRAVSRVKGSSFSRLSTRWPASCRTVDTARSTAPIRWVLLRRATGPIRWSLIRPRAPWPMAMCRSRHERAEPCRRAPASTVRATPTTDPKAVLNGGALLPFGGHKGSSIAMMMEIMGAALAGSDYSFEIDWSAYPGAATPHGGQTYILIDPARGAVNSFTSRLEVLIDEIHDAGQSRLPGRPALCQPAQLDEERHRDCRR